MGRSIAAWGVKLCLLAASPICSATPITYTNEYVWDDALGKQAVTVESFEDVHAKLDPLMLSSVTIDCTASDGGKCSNSFGQSTLMVTDKLRAIRFSGTDSLTFRWDTPITVFAIDVRNLGVDGPADLIIVVNGDKKMKIFSNHTGNAGNTVFFGVMDPDGIRTLSVTTTNSGASIYLDRMMTVAMPEVNITETATPEPATSGLVLSGFALLALARKLQRPGPGSSSGH
jgi:hypothetical protein